MLPVLEVVAGAILLLVVFADALATTLTVSAGAGPVTRRVLGLGWRVMLRLHRSDSESSFLSGAGAGLLATTVLIWVAWLWAGWALVFHGSGAVVDSTTRTPAEPADVAYFSGMTVFTLGTGDFVAATPAWRLVSAVASFSGLFLVTLAITYLISVVAAVVARRSLAIQVHGLGGSAEEIVVGGWRSGGFSQMFEQQLVSITPQVVTNAEQHLAYPVLHYFHSNRRELSAPVALAALDDALLLMAAAVRPECRPDRSAVAPLRSSIERYITTARQIAWVPEAPVPPTPKRTPESAGVPLVPAAEWEAALVGAGDRRRELNRLLVSDGWTWHG